jgi:hypothetical protein
MTWVQSSERELDRLGPGQRQQKYWNYQRQEPVKHQVSLLLPKDSVTAQLMWALQSASQPKRGWLGASCLFCLIWSVWLASCVQACRFVNNN